jgi:transcriptional regulator with XRE-family HTH domain
MQKRGQEAMIDTKRLTLGSFLRTKRLQHSLPQVEQAASRRSYRRVTGLRREEVAQQAGVSISWYTLLEQDRARSMPSPQVLNSLARVLALSSAERTHLFDLARQRVPEPAGEETQVTPQLQHMLEQQLYPAYVVNRYWDIVSWNRAACAVFVDYGALAPEERNVVYQVFANAQSRSTFLNWSSYAQRLLGPLRADYGRYGDDPYFSRLIERLSVLSAEFKQWWPQHDITPCDEQGTIINHPRWGQLMLESTVYTVEHSPGLRLVLYTPLNKATSRQFYHLAAEELENPGFTSYPGMVAASHS